MKDQKKVKLIILLQMPICYLKMALKLYQKMKMKIKKIFCILINY